MKSILIKLSQNENCICFKAKINENPNIKT